VQREQRLRWFPHLTYPQALVVGLFQGVTEMFPVSSLGHAVLIPALVGGTWAQDLKCRRPRSGGVLRAAAPGGTFGSDGAYGNDSNVGRRSENVLQGGIDMVWTFTVGIIYLILMITLGVMTIRKGHWIIFIIGFFLPFFWLIGALMPSRRAAS
jgi:hypothetical protein